ncbi:MAG: MAB_1171c family putative transporter [Pseudonocardiaceae bacterium]
MTLVILLGVLLPALMWKGAQVRRDPANLERWAVVIAIACVTIALLLNVPREYPTVDFGIDARVIQLGQNAAIVGAFGALQLFYLNFVAEYLCRTRLRLEIMVIAVTLGALAVLTWYIIAIDASLKPLPDNLNQPIVAAFYAVGGGYIIYALSTQLWWTIRYGRLLRDTVLRAAAIITAAGTLILLAGSILRLALVLRIAVWGRSFSPDTQMVVLDLIRLGTPILIAGLILPPIVGRAANTWRWWGEFRAYRQLSHLWHAVRWVYPEIIRPATPADQPPAELGGSRYRSAGQRRISPMGFALQSRLAQCRDGYLRAHRFLDANSATITDERARQFVIELKACPRLVLHQTTAHPDTKGRNRLTPDTQQLIAVSRTLYKRGMAWCRDDQPLDETDTPILPPRQPQRRKGPTVDTLISADRLLTGQPGEQIIDGAVLVRDNRIVAVGPRQQVLDRADKPTELHHPGCTLLPGLINTHVHLAFDASPDPITTYQASAPETLLPAMAERARQCLDAGVTTIRDLGDGHGLAIRLREEIAAGTRPGPRILAAGAPLTVPGGHCWFLGGEVNGADSIRAQIRATAAAGADVIKVMASGGHMTPGSAAMWESQFTVDQLRLIVDEARAVGLPVAAHAHGTQAIADAVTAGVTTIEHCTWMTGPGQAEHHEDIARQMAAAGIYAGDTTPPNWTDLAAMFPPGPGRRFGDRLPWMDQLGVQIIIGTDAGLPGAVFSDFVSALQMYENLDFPSERILQFATTNAAKALGLSSITGRLAPGLSADLLVVDGDPLESITALRELRLVMASGRSHIPQRFAAY